MIKLRNITFSYRNNKFTLRDINLDLDVQPTVFIGPNGSGKTTLLKIITLIYRPRRGEILINGVNPWKMKKNEFYDLKKSIVYVHEKPFFFRGTILDNLIYPLEIRGIDRDEAENIVMEKLREFGLDSFAYRKRNQLSAGEGQLLAIIRAVLTNPKILALDEPTSNLDYDKREFVKEILLDEIKKGKQVLISTHDMILAAEVAEKIYQMENGEITRSLTKKELVDELARKLKIE